MIDLQKIEEIKSIIDLVKEDPLLLLVVPIMIISIFLYKAKPIISFIDERKKSKLDKIKSALECDSIDKTTKNFLEKEIINEHFFLSMGINAEEHLRKAVIEAHQKAEGGISFIHFRRGLQYLSYNIKENLLQVKIDPWDKYANWVLFFLSVVLLFIGLVTILAPIALDSFNLEKVVKSAVLGIIFMGVAILAYYQTFAFFSACKIKRELERQKLKIENK